MSLLTTIADEPILLNVSDEPMLLNVSLCMFDMHAERPIISTSGTFGQSLALGGTAVTTGAVLVLLASEDILLLVSFLSLAKNV